VPPIGNTLLLQFQSHLPDIAVVRNSFHVRLNETAGDVTSSFLNDLLDSSGTDDLVSAYRGMLSERMELDGILLRQVQDPLNPGDTKLEQFRADQSDGLLPAGAVGSPMEMTGILSLHTDTAGRRFRGHVFLPPPLDTDQIVGSHWSNGGAYDTAVRAFEDQLVLTMEPAGGAHYDGAWNDVDLVIYSRRARALDQDQFFAQVQSPGWNRKVHWLRSRSPEI
jgi:hypothetical protein